MTLDVSPLTLAVLALPAGALLGHLQLAALRRNLHTYLERGVEPSGIAAHALRLAAVSAAFVALVPLGASALVGALSGWTLARALWLHKTRSTP